jgi:acyl-CoA reductase-like NAD-dependent aldehyde dehydrogenase
MEITTATESADAAGNGASGESGDAPAAETIEVRRPTDGSLIQTVEVDAPQRVSDIAARLRRSQPAWEALGVEGRRRWLGRLRDWLIDNDSRVADILQEETGKVRADAEGEVPVLCGEINFYGENAAEFLADETPASQFVPLKVKRFRVAYRPYQLVGVIAPWNFPILLSLGDAIPALMAGAAVLIKPSEVTPLAVMEIVRAWKDEVGGPDVLDVVNGTGETGGALVDESDFVQFTGSDRTGKVVMKRAADTLTPVSLELGGKDPMIVLDGADVERAANAATWGGLANTGQICMSIERVYVEEPIYDDFVARMTEKVGKLRQGADGSKAKSDLGAMTSPAQVGIIEEQVEDAREKGARVITGGKRKPGEGDWYEPTLIADVDHSMKVMTDETFGPVVPVMKVADAEEAVRMANDTRYGLSASVFAASREEGERIARRLEVGATNVDDVLTNYFCVELPMGGWKESGIGSRHGAYGIRKYCRTEAIVSPRFKQGKRDPLWFPYSPTQRRIVNRVYRFFNARGIRKRLGL